MKKSYARRQERPPIPSEINFDWPKVKYCQSYPGRKSYSELLDGISSKKPQELESALFQITRAGLIEGKSQQDLRAEISPLVAGYSLTESETYVGNKTRDALCWLSKGEAPRYVPQITRHKSARVESSEPRVKTSSLSALQAKPKSPRIKQLQERHALTKIQNTLVGDAGARTPCATRNESEGGAI
jgi:hypothetical protein